MTRRRILVVEDEELIRVVLAEVLADEGFHVVEAGSGDEAAGLLDGPDGFQAVVTDIHMPGARDGIAVGRHARARDPGVPMVYVTGRLDAMAAAGPLGPGDALLPKPYLPSQVLATLRRLLREPGGG